MKNDFQNLKSYEASTGSLQVTKRSSLCSKIDQSQNDQLQTIEPSHPYHQTSIATIKRNIASHLTGTERGAKADRLLKSIVGTPKRGLGRTAGKPLRALCAQRVSILRSEAMQIFYIGKFFTNSKTAAEVGSEKFFLGFQNLPSGSKN